LCIRDSRERGRLATRRTRPIAAVRATGRACAASTEAHELAGGDTRACTGHQGRGQAGGEAGQAGQAAGL
jgi:hypothetical protein